MKEILRQIVKIAEDYTNNSKKPSIVTLSNLLKLIEEELSGNTDLSSSSVQDIIDVREGINPSYKLPKVSRGPKSLIKLKEQWLITKRGFTKDEINKALENYCTDIENRKEGTGYYIHRFTLYDFLKQSNGLLKFANM